MAWLTDTETLTIIAPGFTTTVDPVTGVTRAVPNASVQVSGVDVQPAAGGGNLVPEAFKESASFTAFVDCLGADAATLRGYFTAGRIVERANGDRFTVLHVADWGFHLTLVLGG